MINNVKIEDMDLTVRASNALRAEGIEDTYQLIKYSRAELSRVHNLGKASLSLVEDWLYDRNLTLRDNCTPRSSAEDYKEERGKRIGVKIEAVQRLTDGILRDIELSEDQKIRIVGYTKGYISGLEILG